MKKLTLSLLALCFFSITVFVAAALGPAPSWQLTQGTADTCSIEGGFSLPGVEVNIPTGQASEQGVLSAPGEPSLGFTQDTAYGPNVGTLGGFFVFVTGAYSLPPNTPLTLSVTTYNGTNYTGGVSYVSTITWDCTTGALLASPVTDSCPNPLPDGAVVGEAPLGAQVYWEPAADKSSPGVVLNPGTYYVLGVDETGEYTKIWLSCQSVFWVQSAALQPSYQPPWSGQPLPTNVVS